MITVATPADRDTVVSTVLEAFRKDTAFAWFFPEPDTFDDYASAFAGWLFDKRVRQGTVWLADGGAAVAMWDGPESTSDGSVPGPAVAGETARRLDVYGDVLHPLFPHTPHWYLGVLGTHPDHAGRRLGRALLDAGLERAAADGVPACLETATEVNVGIYQRAGMEIEHHVMIEGLPIWVMRRG